MSPMSPMPSAAMAHERTPDGRRLSRSDTGLSSSIYTNAHISANTNSSPAFRRRSSNFSDYSQDARDLLNPRPLPLSHSLSHSHSLNNESMRHGQPTSSWDSLPLAFALLPAVGGVLVQGGSAFVTDLMLLCLGGIFLHWSVTQPWTWYHSAQQVREDHEARTADVAVGDGEDETNTLVEADEEAEAEGEREEKEKEKEKDANKAQDEENTNTMADPGAASEKARRLERQRERQKFHALQESALRELYRHEVLALLSCFVCPVMGAYLLHALRDQLTRPSEGLISNFNLTVFIMGAELRPLRHLLQLVQARTLHLQRIVHANPYREEEEQYRARREQEESAQNQTLSDLVHRLELLEGGKAADKMTGRVTDREVSLKDRDLKREKRDRDLLLREARAQIQPELDTLARALRRTHKQQALLENQVTHRFRTTDQRLNDAVSIITARQRPSFAAVVWLYIVSSVASSWVAVQWVFESLVLVLLYIPRRVAVCAAAVVALPATAAQGVFSTDGRDANETREARNGKAGKTSKKSVRELSIVGGTIRSKNVVEADHDYDYGRRG